MIYKVQLSDNGRVFCTRSFNDWGQAEAYAKENAGQGIKATIIEANRYCRLVLR